MSLFINPLLVFYLLLLLPALQDLYGALAEAELVARPAGSWQHIWTC